MNPPVRFALLAATAAALVGSLVAAAVVVADGDDGAAVTATSVVPVPDESFAMEVVAVTLRPVVERRGTEVALAGSPRRVGGKIEALVFVLNRRGRDRRLRSLDLRLFDDRGRPVTKKARFLEGQGLPVEARASILTLVAFRQGQVVSDRPVGGFSVAVVWR